MTKSEMEAQHEHRSKQMVQLSSTKQLEMKKATDPKKKEMNKIWHRKQLKKY